MTSSGNTDGKKNARHPLPRVIALELTRSCVLSCRHCRASACSGGQDENELSKDEYFRLIDSIASFARPILILSGGEPMLRPDLYDIIGHARKRGLPVALAPCGVLIDDSAAGRIARSGVRMVSISLDGANARTHDAFRGVSGAFEAALRGMEALKRAKVPFQINATVCKHNAGELERIWQLAGDLGAALFNPFFLVATGRGSALAGLQLDAREYETVLQKLAGRFAAEDNEKIPLRVTCAPHYQRIIRQGGMPAAGHSGGCLGGKSFAFVSHLGKVQICGFLDLGCGDLRLENYNFEKIWRHSEMLKKIRNVSAYNGRCGRCEYRKLCGGCRARAFAASGDYLGDEPCCLHNPHSESESAGECYEDREAKSKQCPHPPMVSGKSSDLDRQGRTILQAVQTEMPIEKHPFDALAQNLGIPPDRFIQRLRELSGEFIKRIGPIFNSGALGYSSTLVGARVPEERLDEVAGIINKYPAVTHNYRRSHVFNLWFTLITRRQERLNEIQEEIKKRSGLNEFYNMPARRVYKIRACFSMDEDKKKLVNGGEDLGQSKPSNRPGREIDKAEKELIQLLQTGIPLDRKPFLHAAKALGWDEEDVAGRLREWYGEGIIRRFGAVLQHRRSGFRANGMCVFEVPEPEADRAGALLAGLPQVTHCYLREAPPEWGYNLFAMTHSSDKRVIRDLLADTAGRIGASSFDVLFSTHEYKKTAMRYFA